MRRPTVGFLGVVVFAVAAAVAVTAPSENPGSSLRSDDNLKRAPIAHYGGIKACNQCKRPELPV